MKNSIISLSYLKLCKILFCAMVGMVILSQLTACASTVTKIPTHSKADILREEMIQAQLVSKKLALR